MEKRNKKISVENHKRYIEEMGYFGWEVENIKIDENNMANVTLIRDPEMKNYEKLRELEDQWFSYNYPPLWPMIVLCGLAFALITALLVIWMVFKGPDFNGMMWFLALGLPAFILMALAVCWFGYRLKKMQNVFSKMDQERIKIKSEAALLRNENERSKD